MKTASAFFIALRYLLGRAGEGGRYLRGAASGIAVSLVPIIVTLIVADGMIRGIIDRHLELGTGHIQIRNLQEPMHPEAALPYLEGISGIRGAWAEQQGIGVILGSSGSRGAAIRAVDNSFWDDPGGRRYLQNLSGEARPETNRDVILGTELARSIGASIGSTVRIMTTHTTLEGRSIPCITAFTVRGIVASGYNELDALWCIMTLEAGRQILPETSAYLMLKIDDPYNRIGSMASSLEFRIGSGFRVSTWESLLYAQYQSFASTRQLLLFIMALIVLVAAVNVSSATSMLVFERQKDIAVLKAAGAGPSFTSAVFLWGAFLTGLTGAVSGIAFGLIIGCNVNTLVRLLERFLSFFTALFHAAPVTILDSGFYLETIPIIVNAKAIFAIGFFTIASSILASWIPARNAGKLKPIDIFQKY